jgi:hypothetical protein
VHVQRNQANCSCKQIENLQSKNANLRRTRDLLLPRLISGAVDVAGLAIQVEPLPPELSADMAAYDRAKAEPGGAPIPLAEVHAEFERRHP